MDSRGYEAGAAVARLCRDCGARLARDNPGVRCAPCQRNADHRALPQAMNADFWAHPTMQAARETKEMGKVVRAYRHHPCHGEAITQAKVAAWVGMTQVQVSRIETGSCKVRELESLIHWARVLRMPATYAWFEVPDEASFDEYDGAGPLVTVPDMKRRTVIALPAAIAATAVPGLDKVEALRQAVSDTLVLGTMTEASIDDWEHTVLRYGHITRHSPALILLADLTADFDELRRVLSRRQPVSVMRRLTRVTAQMSGLISLTLIKLGERSMSRNWARTARLAANEAGDPAVQSWVRAQEAYILFYSGDLHAAIDVARHAQVLAGRGSCVGSALAAPLEARAHAALGRHEATDHALGRAETALERLDHEGTVESAFGYNEAQLRFHEGNAWTHLRNTDRAWRAQKRALALYSTSDYFDRTLIHLDRATCLAHDGQSDTALAHATEALLDLPDDHRDGLILLRARELAASIPHAERTRPEFRELRDLVLTAESAHAPTRKGRR